VSGNTGLLTERCDPYGAESSIKLMGGTIPENQVGKYHWYCRERATGRFRFYCKGGEYGFRRANDQGIVTAYQCPGGHTGVVMPLCRVHQRELSVGPPKPGFDASYRPFGQVGGTKANELCPACALGKGTGHEQQIRDAMERANALQQQISTMMYIGLIGEVARLQSEQDKQRAILSEMHERGFTHRCPLILREVS
jgi:hypothetical protein